jgi:hypothetical protein
MPGFSRLEAFEMLCQRATLSQARAKLVFVTSTSTGWRSTFFLPKNMLVSRGISFALSWNDQREEYHHEFS